MVVAAFMTRLVILAGHRWGPLDKPDGYRKLHGRSVPRLGGIAIYVGVLVPVGLLLFFRELSLVADVLLAYRSVLVGLLVGGTMAVGVGLSDDLFDLKPRWKLAGQILCGIVAYWFGFRIGMISNPFGAPLDLGIFGFPISVFWFVACMNAINLLDGLDGLAAGASLFVCLTMLLVGLVYSNVFGLLFMAALSGALLGFLFFNFPPARVFMGDSGSMLLGFLIAGISLAGSSRKAETAVALFIPLVALGLPMFDMMLAVVRRWYHRVPLSFPDHSHIHHALVAMGYSPKRAVLLLYLGSVVLGGAAVVITVARSNELILLVMGSLAIMFFVALRGFSGVRVVDVLAKLSQDQERRVEMVSTRMALERTKVQVERASDWDQAWIACQPLLAALKLTSARLSLDAGTTGRVLDWHGDSVEQGKTVDKWQSSMILYGSDRLLGNLTVERTGKTVSGTCHMCEFVEGLRDCLEIAGRRIESAGGGNP